MINIRQKTALELKEEQSSYEFGAHIAKGISKTACPTYLVKRDGTRIDTWDLSEEQLLGLIQIDLVDFTSPSGNYKKENRFDLDTFKLLDSVKGHYTPSINATIKMAKLQTQYGHIVADIMGTMGCMKHFRNAKLIATFNKESALDFEPVTNYEVIDVLQQMALNEKNKKNNTSKRK